MNAPRLPGNKDVLALLQESEFHISGMAGITRVRPGSVAAAAAAAATACRCITHLGQINDCEEPEKLRPKSTTAAGVLGGWIKAGGTSDDVFSSSSHAVVRRGAAVLKRTHLHPARGRVLACVMVGAALRPLNVPPTHISPLLSKGITGG